MKDRVISNIRRGDRHITTVAVIVVIQAIAAAFFLADAVVDISTGELSLHIFTEMLIAFALLAGIGLGAWQTAQMIEQARHDADALAVARGAASQLMDLRFRQWGLTDAEAEVALFSLKGFEVAEIARLRNVAEGTVRAQLTSIYAKSGVSSRHALLSLFFEDLIEIEHH